MHGVLLLLCCPRRTIGSRAMPWCACGRPPRRKALYWKMRVVSAYMDGGHEIDPNMAMAYPLEFIWAIGYGMHAERLPLLRDLMAVFDDHPEHLWRGLRAMQRIGTDEDVRALRAPAYLMLEHAEV